MGTGDFRWNGKGLCLYKLVKWLKVYRLQERHGIRMDINVGDVVRLKKQHPCGSKEWEVLRSGADFRLKCKGCGHQIMMARTLLEKSVKEIL